MKQVLILASVASMIAQFNIPNVQLLKDMGYEVDVACNFKEGNPCSDEKIEELKQTLEQMEVSYYQIDFARRISHIWQNVKAFHQVNALLNKNKYEFVHCHSPIGGVIGRLVGKKTHTKVIYTAHGFHFYKGAPLKNWLVYYPIEKLCSYMTDILICINKEDYQLAQRKFYAKRVEYVPGVGIDLQKFEGLMLSRQDKEYQFDYLKSIKFREKIGITNDEIMFLSVGELNKNKNHAVVIKAFKEMKRENQNLGLHYVIAGIGKLEKRLKKMTLEYGIANNVHFLGFQKDMIDWYRSADVFVFPSIREGLSVSLMEAMASGLPCLVSDIRGNRDLIENKKYRFDPKNENKLAELISDTVKNIQEIKRNNAQNCEIIKRFSVDIVLKETWRIYIFFQE